MPRTVRPPSTLLPSRDFDNNQRLDQSVAYRKKVIERNEIVLLEHQAQFLMPTEGFLLSDQLAEDNDPYCDVRLEDHSIARRLLIPRPGGVAHCAVDLAGYKSGKSFSLGVWASGYAGVVGAKVDFVGLEYATSEHEFNVLTDLLLTEKGMCLEYDSFTNDKRNGRMWLKLKNGTMFEVRSWRKKEAMKGDEVDAYVYTEAYQLPGLSCYSNFSQNLRKRNGHAVFATTPDRPWVEEMHKKGHGADPEWNCVCGVDAKVNPFTFDQAARDRDDPDKGGLMTRERFSIAWQGRVGKYIGSIYDYDRERHQFTPFTHPQLWNRGVLESIMSGAL